MEVDDWLQLIAIILLLGLSAFFSSVESAYFSLSRSTLESMRGSDDPRAKRVGRLMNDPRKLLTAILAGNTIVNTAAAALAALLALSWAPKFGVNPNAALLVEVAVVSAAILFLSELTPKLMALRNPEGWALQTASAVGIVQLLLTPIALPLSLFAKNFSHLLGIERRSALAMTEEEIHALIHIGQEHGALELDERLMIHSIFQFGDTIVREVMVPRIDVVAVEKGLPLDELIKIVVAHGHSRIPVYDANIDNVIGLVHAKDLLSATSKPEEFNLTRLVRPCSFVPEEKKIDHLLRDLQHEKTHMAIVVDEYGGTAGIVTMEDIIEEIVGEIQDEYDREQPLTKRIDDNTIVASGRIGVYDLNTELGFELLPVDDAYDTLAGFVYSQLGVVPRKEQKFDYRGYTFVVEEVLGKKITRVRVLKDGGVFG